MCVCATPHRGITKNKRVTERNFHKFWTSGCEESSSHCQLVFGWCNCRATQTHQHTGINCEGRCAVTGVTGEPRFLLDRPTHWRELREESQTHSSERGSDLAANEPSFGVQCDCKYLVWRGNVKIFGRCSWSTGQLWKPDEPPSIEVLRWEHRNLCIPGGFFSRRSHFWPSSPSLCAFPHVCWV